MEMNSKLVGKIETSADVRPLPAPIKDGFAYQHETTKSSTIQKLTATPPAVFYFFNNRPLLGAHNRDPSVFS